MSLLHFHLDDHRPPRKRIAFTRRQVLEAGLGLGIGLLIGTLLRVRLAMASDLRLPIEDDIEKIEKSDDAWKRELPHDVYEVLRHEGTEAPFSNQLNDEHRKGMFVCAGCGLPLFPSAYKFNSGTGWPSFFDALPHHIETKTDHKLIVPRTEYHCARCGGHQGHLFKDGPKPTGLRYCNNGLALRFIPEGT